MLITPDLLLRLAVSLLFLIWVLDILKKTHHDGFADGLRAALHLAVTAPTRPGAKDDEVML